MKQTFRHGGVVMMMTMVALGLVGAAYTLWFEDLRLNVNATTGTFDADWSIYDICNDGLAGCVENNPTANDQGIPVVHVLPAPADIDDPAEPDEYAYSDYTNGKFLVGTVHKPTPQCFQSRSNFGSAPDNTNDLANNNLLELTINGAFPYAGCMFQFDIHSSGTVPMHFAILEATWTCTPLPACGPDAQQFVFISDPVAGPGNTNPDQCKGLIDAINDFTAPAEVLWGESAPVPLQIHADTDLVCSVKVILRQTAAEASSYRLAVVLRAHQWNENVVAP